MRVDYKSVFETFGCAIVIAVSELYFIRIKNQLFFK